MTESVRKPRAPKLYVALCANGGGHVGEHGWYVGGVPGPSLAKLDERTLCGPHRELVYQPDPYKKHRTAEHGGLLPKGW